MKLFLLLISISILIVCIGSLTYDLGYGVGYDDGLHDRRYKIINIERGIRNDKEAEHESKRRKKTP